MCEAGVDSDGCGDGGRRRFFLPSDDVLSKI